MTALLSPSMPMQMAPDRLTFAFSMRTTRRLGFLSLALIAAIGPPVPPPITSRSVSMVSVLLSLAVMHVARRGELRPHPRLRAPQGRGRRGPAAGDKAKDRCRGRAH